MSSDSNEHGKKNKPYKTYKYPDGRILELTKEEFEEVAEVFRRLINQKRKLEGKVLLLKPDEVLIREFLNRAKDDKADE